MVEQWDRSPTGFQIAFLIVALLFLAAPAEKYLFNQWSWGREHGIPITRFAIFAAAAIALFGVPSLRRLSVKLLSAPIARGQKHEIAIAWLLNLTAGFAGLGAVILLAWMAGGDAALARHANNEMNATEQMSRALALGGILIFVVLGGLIAPIIEEIVFRGLLYPAWARQWGWLASAVATSLLFALIHPNQFAQFFASLIYIGLYRRTGSLRAPIIVHGLYNISMWYPLLGQFIFPVAPRGTCELSHWYFNLVCLAAVTVILPIYLWISRDGKASVELSRQEFA
jgi:membrane protease YdiL (CAAX protease family)